MNWDSMVAELRLAGRRLAHTPWFTLAVASTIALAIGANTAVFSIVEGVVLRPLPYRAPDQLVAVVNTGPRPADNISPLDVADLRGQVHGLSLAEYTPYSSPTLQTGTEPLRLKGALASANWFAMFGLPLELGRGFAQGEDKAGAPHVVVLSDALWRTRFGSDPHILGRTLRLNDSAYQVIGVAPASFAFPNDPDVWLPLVLRPEELTPAYRGLRYTLAVGRLGPGTSLAQARSELAVAYARLHDANADIETGLQYDVVPLHDHIVGGARPTLLLLWGAVACLLLIACVTTANLFLVRATSRASEIGIRVALGASRWRVVRELTAESALIAGAGGVAGVGLAWWAVRVIVAGRLVDLPRLAEVSIDGGVLAVTLLAVGVTALLAGAFPALQALTPGALRSVKSGVRSATVRSQTRRLRAVFVVSEMAIAVPMLIVAVLLGRSFARLVAVDPGFRSEHVVRFDIARTDTVEARLRIFTDELLRRLDAMPGTQAAAAGLGVPFSGMLNGREFHVVGHAPETRDRPNFSRYIWATPKYFSALSIPVLKGRTFDDKDGVNGAPVVIVNRTFARRFLDSEDPIGRTLTYPPVPDSTGRVRADTIGVIVGVVGDTKTEDLATPMEPAMYIPYNQLPIQYETYVVRSMADPGRVVGMARTQLAAIDPSAAIFNASALDEAMDNSTARPRFNARLVAAFAALALLLAVMGIYGVVAYAVRERQRELGIRVALGARGDQVVGLVLRQGLALAAVGTGIGFVLALAATRLLRSLLYGVAPTDTVSYVAVFTIAVSLALVASWVPARAASAVDPVIAMRPE